MDKTPKVEGRKRPAGRRHCDFVYAWLRNEDGISPELYDAMHGLCAAYKRLEKRLAVPR